MDLNQGTRYTVTSWTPQNVDVIKDQTRERDERREQGWKETKVTLPVLRWEETKEERQQRQRACGSPR